MRVISGRDLGLPGGKAELFDSLPFEPEHFSPGKTLGLWEQWVRELERGQLWVPEELKAACTARDDVEDFLAVVPGDLSEVVFAFVDVLDRLYRDLTVTSTYVAEHRTDSRWWWGRIPVGNAQRRYLFG